MGCCTVKEIKNGVFILSAFLIIIGFIITFSGMIFSPHVFHKNIRNLHDAKAISYLCMLPGILIFSLGFYLK